MKLKQHLLFMLCVSIFSCSTESVDSPNEEEEEETTDFTLIKRIVYNEGTADEYSETFNYDGNKLINVDYGDGYKNVYTYDANGDLIKDDFYEENVIIASIVLEYDTDNKLTKFTENFLDGSGLEDRKYQHNFTYNNDDSITVQVYISYLNADYELSRTDTITFDNKNIVKFGNEEYYNSYAYDDKKGMFKNIHAIEILNILNENEFGALIYGNTNNAISFKENGGSNNYNDNYQYTYNSEDYPISAIYSSVFGSINEDMETINFYYE